jgi:predicted amidohydrolase
VEATLERYRPHLDSAAEQGAELVLLPEVCVTVDRESRRRFIDAVASFAGARGVTVIAPFFDASIPKNELVIVDSSGSVVARYEKQHPVAHVEGKREARMRPGPVPLQLGARELVLSTVICVDLDYGDLVKPVRNAGGLLAAPSNDWPRFDELHHRSAVWSAVVTGVPVVRATGWGVSAVFDGAGRVLARASSHDGPVVLTVDVPVAEPVVR